MCVRVYVCVCVYMHMSVYVYILLIISKAYGKIFFFYFAEISSSFFYVDKAVAPLSIIFPDWLRTNPLNLKHTFLYHHSEVTIFFLSIQQQNLINHPLTEAKVKRMHI